MNRMERYIWARCYIPDCIVEGKLFDYIKFAKGTGLLTGRQLEAVFGHMHDGVTLEMIAGRQEINKSTVWRSEQRGIKNFASGGVTFDESIASGTLATEDYANMSEREICEYLGVSPGDYYRIVCRKHPVGNMPRFQYEVMKRFREGKTPTEISNELRVPYNSVNRTWKLWMNEPLPEPPEDLEEYNPKVWDKNEQPKTISRIFTNQRKYGIIADNISAPVYMKLIKGGGDNAAGT